MSKQKEKFFAQYWEQKVMCSEVESNPFEVNENNLHRWIPECYLELTPLSQISDEDADYISGFTTMTMTDFSLLTSEFGIDFDNISCSFWEFTQVIDYLRSKGYALPWLGISVEEQIKLGWIKLKDNG